MDKPLDIRPGDRILVSRTDRLGDLILALPFAATLKARYPECSVEVLASLYASPILENNNSVDRIVRVQNDQLVSNKAYKKDLLHRIKMSEYRIVVALYPEKHVCQLFYKAGIPIRVGTAGRFHSVYFSHHLLHSRKSNRRHEYEYNLEFLRFFRGGEIVEQPTVYPLERELHNARRILREAGVAERFVVLHPGSGGSAERWPVERFIELYDRLRLSGVGVVVSGSEREGTMIRQLIGDRPDPLMEITGETDLRTLAAVLSLANIVVANSTGPLHLASAVGTRVVGLYPGRRVMSPNRWGPLGPENRVIQPSSTDCQCPPHQCRCMETISVDDVASQVIDLYNKPLH
ncbi:MAG: glycosyltransferase family 9 protein [Candidatus Zixiibacteriota bacterium]